MNRDDEIPKMVCESAPVSPTDDENPDEAKKGKPKKKKKFIIYNLIRQLVMLVALVIFGYAAYELTLIYVESQEGNDIKNETSNMFMVKIEDLIDTEAGDEQPATTIEIDEIEEKELFVFDYDKMLEYNSEAKGYIRQDDGDYIDNPILQHTDNEYYLSHLANHNKSSIGAIFIDCNIKEGLEARNCIIYGHNIGQRAGRIMFGSLNWYYSEENYYKEHPTFDIWIENKHYRYYVFAAYKTKAAGSQVYTYSFASDDEFMNYVEQSKRLSIYNFTEAPEITPESKIVTLSTCTHADEYRMIVQLVRGEELDVFGNVINAEAAQDEAGEGEETTD